jgi:hypothetical protein
MVTQLRFIPVLVGIANAAMLVTVAAQASPFSTSGQFDQVTTITAPRVQLKFVQTIRFKDGNIRVDKTDLSQFIPLTQIETVDTFYLYSMLSGTGEKSTIAEKLPPLLERMDSDTKSKLIGATKTGSETYDGYNCDTYSTSEDNGDVRIEFWVSKDPKFPFTLKTVATDKTLSKVTTVNLDNIDLNVELEDSLFEVPANIKLSAPQGSAQSGPASSAAPEAQTTPSASQNQLSPSTVNGNGAQH